MSVIGAFPEAQCSAPQGAWSGLWQRGRGGSLLPGEVLPGLLARGTLMAEFVLERGQFGPLSLVHMATHADWPRLFSLAITTEGRLMLRQRQGDALAAVSLDAADLLAGGGALRVSFSWDAPAGQSVLTLESLDGGAMRQRAGANPLPLPAADLDALLTGHGAAVHCSALRWLGLARGQMPVGPGALFAPSTPLETPKGPRPAAQILAGDWVNTLDAGVQKVQWSGRVRLPALGALAPIRLSAGRFAKSTDLWVLPQTQVAVTDATVEYLFGTDAVLVEARYLVDQLSVTQIERPVVLSWHGILLRGHHVLIADGFGLESLFLGALAGAPELAATTALAPLVATGAAPLHRRPALRVLRPFEAASLAAARSRFHAPVAA